MPYYLSPKKLNSPSYFECVIELETQVSTGDTKATEYQTRQNEGKRNSPCTDANSMSFSSLHRTVW